MADDLSTPVHVVDVFSQGRYTGNQLAVVRDAHRLSADEMGCIAREMDYSETAFVTDESPADGGYGVRLFTPEAEVPFAGHAVLGTASVIRDAIADGDPDEITLSLSEGSVTVTADTDGDEPIFWLEDRSASFLETLDPEVAADVVDVAPGDVARDLPCQVVSTGLPQLMVPLESLDAVRRATTNETPYYEHVVDGLGVKAVLVFARETYESESDLNVRVFVEAHGIPEDSATGSANTSLAALLLRERTSASELRLTAEQGYEMDRPSTLHLRADRTDDSVVARVGGRVSNVLEGRLL
ncbi:PhzF family phenazine biosynthesis protein [Halorussus caseinilyticus]|uniref:PhzF family phenazine biosynthesis protein n=1 Tax=Halorussus caseinilyticus TaxID=3034025 RepID=UPI0023E7EC2B|nr:PhzF family phenazine biosynthesis protein [Halorussus sp. DT72]